MPFFYKLLHTAICLLLAPILVPRIGSDKRSKGLTEKVDIKYTEINLFLMVIF